MVLKIQHASVLGPPNFHSAVLSWDKESALISR